LFTNHVKIEKAYLLSRYHKLDEIIYNLNIGYQEPPGSSEWRFIKKDTKQSIFNKITRKHSVHHTKISDLLDDVIILASIPIEEDDIKIIEEDNDLNYYMYFWYDHDNYDCCIGRFNTKDTNDEVYRKFDNYCIANGESLSYDNFGYKEPPLKIPLDFFKGKIKW
jgi:hypothetical protein